MNYYLLPLCVFVVCYILTEMFVRLHNACKKDNVALQVAAVLSFFTQVLSGAIVLGQIIYYLLFVF